MEESYNREVKRCSSYLDVVITSYVVMLSSSLLGKDFQIIQKLKCHQGKSLACDNPHDEVALSLSTFLCGHHKWMDFSLRKMTLSGREYCERPRAGSPSFTWA